MAKILICIFTVLLIFNQCTAKYNNPYTLSMVFGKKGSGKTTYLCKLAQTYLRKGWNVYTNIEIPNTYKFNIGQFGSCDFPEDSLILIDEASLIWDNRDFKNFKPSVAKYLRLQRHKKVKIILFSQTFDVDKKVRDLCDELYLNKKFLRIFVITRRINKHITISNGSENQTGVSNLVEDYKFDLPIGSGIQFTFIPYWSKYFNSFENTNLPCINSVENPIVNYSPRKYFELVLVYTLNYFKNVPDQISKLFHNKLTHKKKT